MTTTGRDVIVEGRCKCCRRRGLLSRRRLCSDCAVCLHCERRPAVSRYGLCKHCHRKETIRQLYRRGPHWTPEWEMHLRRKTAEVQRMLANGARDR